MYTRCVGRYRPVSIYAFEPTVTDDDPTAGEEV